MRPVYALRVRPEPDVDAIRSLRAWLKRGLRDFGLHCLEIHQEQQEQKRSDTMAINLNDVEGQKDPFPPLPEKVYRLEINVIPGGVGKDGLLHRANKNGKKLQLKLECTVIGGEYDGRRLWDYPCIGIDEAYVNAKPLTAKEVQSMHTSLRLGKIRLRAIIDSAFGLDPNDRGAENERRRTFDDYAFFHGLQFWAQVITRPANGGYNKESNGIDFVVVPGDPAYPTKEEREEPPTTAVVPHKPAWQDMDDEMPF